MDRALLRKAAMQSVALMITVVLLSYSLNNYHTIVKAASFFMGSQAVRTDAVTSNQLTTRAGSKNNALLLSSEAYSSDKNTNIPINDVMSLKQHINSSILSKLGEDFLVIEKPMGQQQNINLTDFYIEHSIQLDISKVSDPNVTSSMIYRVRGNELFRNDPAYTEVIRYEVNDDTGEKEKVIIKDYGDDLCHGITVSSEEVDNSNLYAVRLYIELNTVYAYSVEEDANYYYISLKKPSEVYDKIIVIDPGHGGKDAGAIALNNKTYEKDINLAIAMELKTLLDRDNIKVYYTRTQNDTVFLRPRSSLANAVDCDYFISIHCNSNGLSYPNGTEVLFKEAKVKAVSNKALADLFSVELSKSMSLKKKGIIEKQPEDIFIMDQCQVPMILIEIGYLSNANDLNYLTQKVNQKAVAQGIYNGIKKAYEQLPTKK